MNIINQTKKEILIEIEEQIQHVILTAHALSDEATIFIDGDPKETLLVDIISNKPTKSANKFMKKLKEIKEEMIRQEETRHIKELLYYNGLFE